MEQRQHWYSIRSGVLILALSSTIDSGAEGPGRASAPFDDNGSALVMTLLGEWGSRGVCSPDVFTTRLIFFSSVCTKASSCAKRSLGSCSHSLGIGRKRRHGRQAVLSKRYGNCRQQGLLHHHADPLPPPCANRSLGNYSLGMKRRNPSRGAPL